QPHRHTRTRQYAAAFRDALALADRVLLLPVYAAGEPPCEGGASAAPGCCARAQEIHDRLRGQGTTVGIASVYRTLELLHERGLVTRVDTGDGVARYEPALPGGEHHHHIVCTRCGAVEPFEDDALEAAIHAIGARVDFEVTGHDVALRGLCRACRAA
ncbi:MAG: transcriptional repressor, partial [Gaiellales bacterium]